MFQGNVPDPSSVLPSEGVVAVLVQAAAANPLVALVLVAIIICTAWALSCWAVVKYKQLDVMTSPEAAKAIVELRKLENAQKRAMKKLKQKR